MKLYGYWSNFKREIGEMTRNQEIPSSDEGAVLPELLGGDGQGVCTSDARWKIQIPGPELRGSGGGDSRVSHSFVNAQ